jgi:competence transcription factor ComK
MGLSVLLAAAANALTFSNLESIKGRLLLHVFEIPAGRTSLDRRDVFVNHKGKCSENMNYNMIYNKEC